VGFDKVSVVKPDEIRLETKSKHVLSARSDGRPYSKEEMEHYRAWVTTAFVFILTAKDGAPVMQCPRIDESFAGQLLPKQKQAKESFKEPQP
jgi:hypothetical protein